MKLGPAEARPAPIASTRHTLVLLGIFLLVAILVAIQLPHGGPARTPAEGGHIPLYVGILVSEWLLFYLTLRGLKKAGTPLELVFGDRLRSPRAWVFALLGGVVALGFVVGVGEALNAILTAAGVPIAADNARTTAAVAPHGALEIVLWIAASISAGVCEEFVFRGYLMRQFAAWFGGWGWGLLASAIVFGLGHAYQGVVPVLVIMVHGITFGLVALATRRLGPGMVAHSLIDIISGLTGR